MIQSMFISSQHTMRRTSTRSLSESTAPKYLSMSLTAGTLTPPCGRRTGHGRYFKSGLITKSKPWSSTWSRTNRLSMKNEFNQQVSLISYLLVKMRLLDMRRIRYLISALFAENISLFLSQKLAFFVTKFSFRPYSPRYFRCLITYSVIIYLHNNARCVNSI